MDSERWQNIERLYHAAMECEESQRAAFLAQACCDDEALLREVEDLVSYGNRAGGFIAGSALEVVAPAIATDEGDEHDSASGECRMVGKWISQYRIVEQLGRGGMGEVYRAVRADGQYQKQVAIKLVRAGRESGSVIGRFKNERQILAGLDHPNIARLHDGGATEAGVPYFVMELVEGQPIDEYCDSHRLGIPARVKIFLQVCSALEYAHQHQIIHRDIKPSNILVTAEGVPKLLDFGIAKILDSGVVTGVNGLTQTMARVFTPRYASPEQIKADPITMASDVYSLGVLLYELLTGRWPYRLKTRTAAKIEQAICEKDPLLPSIVVMRMEEPTLADGTTITPEEVGRARNSDPKQMHSCLLGDLDAIMMMALRKEPHRRYASVHDFSEDLRKHLEGRPIAARPSTIAYRGAKFIRRHGELAVGALIFLVLLGGLFALGNLLRWGQSRTSKGKTLTDKDFVVLADFANNTGETVFDDTLKQALAVDLQQSTFLNILSDDRISEQLRYMGRLPDERLTPDVAREVCLRDGSKATLLGSIASLGNHYVITLKAVDCQDSSLLHEEQREADRREKVLTQLHEMGKHLRDKLGESMASIQQHDTPLEQATTTSLEALQAYSMATRVFRSQGGTAALPLFKRAIELDPNFAFAYADLAAVYSNLNENALSMEYAKKAYELRARVTDSERFWINSTYYDSVTGELEKAAQQYEAWKQTYPRSLTPYVNLGVMDYYLGRLSKALDDDLQGLALNPSVAMLYSNLADEYMSLDRLDEAQAILKEAKKRKLDESMVLDNYQLAFLRGDDGEMSRLFDEAAGKTGMEDRLLSSQSDTKAFYGRLRQARDYSRKAVESALRADAKETAAAWQADAALREAEFGNVVQARHDAAAALTLASSKEIEIAAAIVLARIGEITRAQSIAIDLGKRFPLDALLASYWLPSIRAAIAIREKKADRAIEYLKTSELYELGGAAPPFSSGATLYPVYLRGEAYLASRQWNKAAAEFQKILGHRGLVWNFPLGALAQLQLGRAYAGLYDYPKARAAYRDFLSSWDHADADIPIFRAAKLEYAKLH